MQESTHDGSGTRPGADATDGIRVGKELDRGQGHDELAVYRRWERVLARRAAAIEREHDRSEAFAEAAPALAGDHRLTYR